MTLRTAPDQDIVVVGATGDLAQKKLIPALYNLHTEHLIPNHGNIVGVAPMDWTREHFIDHARDSVKQFSRTGINEERFEAFAKHLQFVPLGADSDLKPLHAALTKQRRLIYLAVPPSAFTPLLEAVRAADLARGTSIVIEKPFGHDLKSARQLNRTLHSVVPEERVYRIDHYMGKETVQNLLVFRFGNSLWERVWSRDAISRVEITVAEDIGVEERGPLYEEIGAIRDIVQNHLFQVLSLVCMEPPVSFDAEALRNEKVKVLRSLHTVDPHSVVRGQYAAGTVGAEKVRAYRDEPGVSKESTTETFAAMRLHVESWRWSGVPFLLRTGKRLPVRDTRVVVSFHDAPLHLFREVGMHAMHSNRLVIRIQPNEGISLRFSAKEPGPDVRVQPVDMDFSYGDSFKTSPPEAYERLLHDALGGDHLLFIREDEVEAGWAAISKLLEEPPPICFYAAGTWGPEEAARIAAPGRWHDPDDPDADT
ncbi:MAG: glucose-6-phosphate dehydrogenase [Candidatus Dormibacteraeota bacterium]|nr:glucose-6-phosphate dehydrogenase [Candidatus Dormibacteraeota bacterium]